MISNLSLALLWGYPNIIEFLDRVEFPDDQIALNDAVNENDEITRRLITILLTEETRQFFFGNIRSLLYKAELTYIQNNDLENSDSASAGLNFSPLDNTTMSSIRPR
jgi:hypothetical protein